MRTRVCIPVKNRAWCLPWVLHGLTFQNVDLGEVSIHLHDDGSRDESAEVCEWWAAKRGHLFGGGVVVTRGAGSGQDNTSSRDFTDKSAGYSHLANLRDDMMMRGAADGAEEVIQVDSDTLLGPSLIASLRVALEAADGGGAGAINYYDIIQWNERGAWVCDKGWPLCHNLGILAAPGHFIRYPRVGVGRVFPIGMTGGGVYMVGKKLWEAGVRHTLEGETFGLCLEVAVLCQRSAEKGIKWCAHSGTHSLHIFKPENLFAALGAAYASWGPGALEEDAWRYLSQS